MAHKILFALLCQVSKEGDIFNKVNKYGNSEIGTWKKDPKFLALTAGLYSSAGHENILDLWSKKHLHFASRKIKYHGINSDSTKTNA